MQMVLYILYNDDNKCNIYYRNIWLFQEVGDVRVTSIFKDATWAAARDPTTYHVTNTTPSMNITILLLDYI